MAYLQFLGAAGRATGSKHLINTYDDSDGGAACMCLSFLVHRETQADWSLPRPSRLSRMENVRIAQCLEKVPIG